AAAWGSPRGEVARRRMHGLRRANNRTAARRRHPPAVRSCRHGFAVGGARRRPALDAVAPMNMPRVILFACLLLACGPARLAHAQKPGLPDLAEPTPKLPDLADPMIFVVAHGGPNACGPGCSEWIAAEGAFDRDADARFRRFLD